MSYDFDKSFAISMTKLKNCNFDASLFSEQNFETQSFDNLLCNCVLKFIIHLLALKVAPMEEAESLPRVVR